MIKTRHSHSLLPAILATASVFAQGSPASSQNTKHQAATGTSPMSAAQLYSKFRTAVCTVKTDTGLGTGFNTSSGVWTCYHVIDGAKAVSVEFPSTPVTPANNLLAIDKTLDAAILSGAPPNNPTLKIDDTVEVTVGDPLVVIGSPRGLEQTLTEGILSGKRTMNGLEYLQLSAAISPGSSGSPVFNKLGNVVGMVVGYLPDSQQINFALSAKSLMRLQHGVPIGEIFKVPSVAAANNLDFQTFLKANDFLGKFTFDSLQNMPDIHIMTRAIPDTLKDDVTVEMVSGWVQSELARSAPKLRVKTVAGTVSPTEAIHSLAELLQDRDMARYLDVEILFSKSSRGTAGYSVLLNCDRVVLIAPGQTFASVWSTAAGGFFGSANPASFILRDAVQSTVKQFADEWVRQNH